MNKKTAGISVIGGADGPTSVYIAGKGKRKLSFQQKLQKRLFTARKKRIMKHMKADPHSMDEVIGYIKSNADGYVELGADTWEYQREYCQMRASFLIQHESQLLGDIAEPPKLEDQSTGAVMTFMEQNDRRQKAAEKIPRELFDIDLHIFNKRSGNTFSEIVIEKKYGYIGGSVSGKENMKEFHDLLRKVYRYYGVTQEDIDQGTTRYETLVRALAMPMR